MTSSIGIKQWGIGKLKLNCNFLLMFYNHNLLWNTFSLYYMYVLFIPLWTFYVVRLNIFLQWAYSTLKSWVRHWLRSQGSRQRDVTTPAPRTGSAVDRRSGAGDRHHLALVLLLRWPPRHLQGPGLCCKWIMENCRFKWLESIFRTTHLLVSPTNWIWEQWVLACSVQWRFDPTT